MKVENDVDVLGGEESIDTKSDEVYVPPTLSAKRIDPEVRHSLDPDYLYAGYFCIFHVFSFQYLSLCNIRFWECNSYEQSMLLHKELSRRKVSVGLMWWLDPVRTGWNIMHFVVVTEMFCNLSSLLPHLLVFTVSSHFFTFWQVSVEVWFKRFQLVLPVL